jgi:hypothetical protein
MIERIVAGGQTGVDRAGLDAGLAAGILVGGWCPHGRRAEDDEIPARYPLDETSSPDYRERTELNVRDSDGTLILARRQRLTGGTALARNLAERYGRPVMVVDLRTEQGPGPVIAWLEENAIATLNVAGPRESQQPGIHDLAQAFMCRLIQAMQGEGP